MFFDIIIVIILAILVVNQFSLWTKFKNWYNRQLPNQTVISHRNHKVYIFIALVTVFFALIISFIQATQEVNQTATTLALQQLTFNTEGYSQAALFAQIEVYKTALGFSSIFWLNFFENLAYFILIPILISIAMVFVNVEMQKTKVELEKETVVPEQTQEEVEVATADGEEVNAVEDVIIVDEEGQESEVEASGQ